MLISNPFNLLAIFPNDTTYEKKRIFIIFSDEYDLACAHKFLKFGVT